ncbi:MAG TPA: hypothetical protein VGO58_17500 [Chitinophagaceae bacterium]|jgi:hypothetical protein|nr:hypothetical protein [Chitinophagaceae bacterium]
MKRSFYIIGFIVLSSLVSTAQTYLPFEQVRKYTNTQKANKYDSSLRHLTNRLGAEIHYLYPFYQAIGWEVKFKKSMGEKSFNASFSELLSFAGDYNQAIAYQEKNYDSLSADAIAHIADTISKLKDIQYAPAKASIISNAPHYQVIMINESHAKPIHRAFTYSLLEDLYKEGYRYFAMEAFNNFSNKCLDSLNVFTGYYTYEPVAGELVRKATQLGYKLIAYEDTLASEHSASQRDSVQAAHLWEVLKKDPSAKILVHAGLAHISEVKIGDYTPMAYWFRKMSNIDPFTINQAGMTEGSEFEYGRLFYQYFNTRFSITSSSVIFQGKRPFNPLEERGYDITVMHPATIYRNNRPAWLSLEGERKITLIQPTEKMLFFVQAYYEKEYNEKNLEFLVPADQTYITNREGYYGLYLAKGKYKIVLRDVSYKKLATKDLEVL